MSRVVIGLGNELLGDEGVGIEVVRILKEKIKNIGCKDVEVYEGGVSGFTLLSLIEGKEKVVIVDAVIGNGRPGDVYRFRLSDAVERSKILSIHELDFIKCYRLAKNFSDLPENVVVVGIEPEKFELGGLSSKVKEAIPKALELVIEEICKD
ncbi:MAG: hydrogenase maturation protease [Archaeoglobaceae archaeon]